MEKNRPLAFRIVTLGCKTNQSESDEISAILAGSGLINTGINNACDSISGTSEHIGGNVSEHIGGNVSSRISNACDYIIINTCTVTGATDGKVRQAIRAARKSAPHSTIIVTGCYTVFNAKALKDLGADYIFTNSEKEKLAGFILKDTKNIFQSVPSSERSRAFIKIQDGCGQRCSYCIVPMVRGPYKSTEPEKVIEKINYFVSHGFEEAVLTGIHAGKYGVDFTDNAGGCNGLSGLIKKILENTGIRRIRLSSIEVNEIDNDLINIISGSNKRVAKHLHIPLQSGSNKILSAMNRKYDAGFFNETVKAVKEKIPSITLTTDIIVGFPGETDQDFEMTMSMLENIGFSKTHVFKYSQRQGTAAASMKGQVDERIKKDRSRIARGAADKLRKEFILSNKGVIQETVFEEFNEKLQIASGTSENYLKVYFKPQAQNKDIIKKGKILNIMADAPYREGLFGTII